MTSDWSFVVWILLIGLPVGLVLTTFWARSRGAGSAMLDKPSAEDPRDPI
jgi:hypothetical protein